MDKLILENYLTNDTDIVEKAENIVNTKMEDISVTQLRKILAQISKIQSRIDSDKDYDSHELTNDIAYLRIKLAYQAGRFNDLKNFRLELEEVIKNINGSKTNFKKFARLMEAIVAYHKFIKGDKNGN